MEGVEPSSKKLLNINQRSIVARTGFEPVRVTFLDLPQWHTIHSLIQRLPTTELPQSIPPPDYNRAIRSLAPRPE